MIALGADHGGYRLKEAVKAYLEEKGIPYKDFGTDSEESVNYGPYAYRVAQSIVSGECEKGVLCCGTGIGISIAANKVKGIRAAVVALIAAPTFSMAKSARINRYNIWIPVVSALLIWLLGFSPIWIIIAAGVGGYCFGRFQRPKN